MPKATRSRVAELGLELAAELFTVPSFSAFRTGRSLRHPSPIADRKAQAWRRAEIHPKSYSVFVSSRN